jgi:hypothetical protein
MELNLAKITKLPDEHLPAKREPKLGMTIYPIYLRNRLFIFDNKIQLINYIVHR